ncbi:MAG TPA: glycosyltransferase family 2 protein [Polyangia bacterium]|nr:glycosyltransferase family 2 protein [Polyangia bacterium]
MSRRIRVLAPVYGELLRFPRRSRAPRHALPEQLIVSLTSYPPRFPFLANTVKSLLDQTVKPDRLILWIAAQDADVLPAPLRRLAAYGLEILTCDDLRSFKKIIPVLERWPDSFVLTADDDLYYPPDWLKTIVDGYSPAQPAIVCRRAHLPTRAPDGRLAPYRDWQHEIDMRNDPSPRPGLFPTGIGGVLYYPGSLAPEVTNREAFLALCPRADDVWLYWMGRRAGTRYRQVGGAFTQISWPRSQRVSLRHENVAAGENDRQIRAVEDHYGVS